MEKEKQAKRRHCICFMLILMSYIKRDFGGVIWSVQWWRETVRQREYLLLVMCVYQSCGWRKTVHLYTPYIFSFISVTMVYVYIVTNYFKEDRKEQKQNKTTTNKPRKHCLLQKKHYPVWHLSIICVFCVCVCVNMQHCMSSIFMSPSLLAMHILPPCTACSSSLVPQQPSMCV